MERKSYQKSLEEFLEYGKVGGENFSPNNIKRVLIGYDGYRIDYHVPVEGKRYKEGKYVGVSGEVLRQEFMSMGYLRALRKRVLSSLEEIIFCFPDGVIPNWRAVINEQQFKRLRLVEVYSGTCSVVSKYVCEREKIQRYCVYKEELNKGEWYKNWGSVSDVYPLDAAGSRLNNYFHKVREEEELGLQNDKRVVDVVGGKVREWEKMVAERGYNSYVESVPDIKDMRGLVEWFDSFIDGVYGKFPVGKVIKGVVEKNKGDLSVMGLLSLGVEVKGQVERAKGDVEYFQEVSKYISKYKVEVGSLKEYISAYEVLEKLAIRGYLGSCHIDNLGSGVLLPKLGYKCKEGHSLASVVEGRLLTDVLQLYVAKRDGFSVREVVSGKVGEKLCKLYGVSVDVVSTVEYIEECTKVLRGGKGSKKGREEMLWERLVGGPKEAVGLEGVRNVFYGKELKEGEELSVVVEEGMSEMRLLGLEGSMMVEVTKARYAEGLDGVDYGYLEYVLRCLVSFYERGTSGYWRGIV